MRKQKRVRTRERERERERERGENVEKGRETVRLKNRDKKCEKKFYIFI